MKKQVTLTVRCCRCNSHCRPFSPDCLAASVALFALWASSRRTIARAADTLALNEGDL